MSVMSPTAWRLVPRAAVWRTSCRERQPGFTLIEVLVALVILAIGALGVTAVQIRGLRFGHDAYLRSQATILAYDITERLRANADNAASYVSSADPAGTCSATAAGITNDLNCWYERIAQTLPGASAAIAPVAGNAGAYRITISWLDRDSGSTLAQQWEVEP